MKPSNYPPGVTGHEPQIAGDAEQPPELVMRGLEQARRFYLSKVMPSAVTSTCESTTGGWLWYCDAHDTHGNAESEKEAMALAKTHRKYAATEQEQWCDIFVYETWTKKDDEAHQIGEIT